MKTVRQIPGSRSRADKSCHRWPHHGRHCCGAPGSFSPAAIRTAGTFKPRRNRQPAPNLHSPGAFWRFLQQLVSWWRLYAFGTIAASASQSPTGCASLVSPLQQAHRKRTAGPSRARYFASWERSGLRRSVDCSASRWLFPDQWWPWFWCSGLSQLLDHSFASTLRIQIREKFIPT